MRIAITLAPIRAAMLLAVLGALMGGCSRTKYRLQADREAYHTIAERNGDPRWGTANVSIEMDPKSRFFDPYDPDHSPMPPDDPTSHMYMHCVDGMRGWKHWHDNGHRSELENPSWRDALGHYVTFNDDGDIQLDMESSVRLAYVNSPTIQRQLETLYLSSLDVTAERFFLDTQFFGGYGVRYAHTGSLVPAQLQFSPLLNRFIITPPFDGPGIEQNRLTVGRPFGVDPALQLQRRFATAGELLIGFANSFVFEFTGSDVNLASSLINFSFIQPLLRGAGRDVALEQLTLEERNLLANLRAFAQFRQGFYTQIAIGELGVTGPQRFGQDTMMQSFSGQGGVNGYLGLLQQLQQIRNSEDNLSLQLRTLDRLEALYDNELIDLVQVDQFRQSVESQRAELLVRRNALELALDQYKASTLGVPPNLPVDLDDGLIEPFQLFPREATEIQDSLLAFQRRLSQLPVEPMLVEIEAVLAESQTFIEPVEQLFAMARDDVANMESQASVREDSMTRKEAQRFQGERERLLQRLDDLEHGELGFDVAVAYLENLQRGLTNDSRVETLRRTTAWVGALLQIVERLSLVPAQARLEVIAVDAIDLDADTAFQIALANRLDFMNGRAALVDRWRAIQVNADALQAILDVTVDGDVRTAKNNPLDFRASTSRVSVGLEFDAPFTRLLERNAYRESLIEYQRSRRDFIQSQDALLLGLRALLRNLEQLRQNLEIQRRAVTIAMRRVDQTQLELTEPRPPVQPGARPAINPTTAINLLSAQSSLQSTQNAFLSAWLSYYATRMRLYRELGILALDPEGMWIEYPIDAAACPVPGFDLIPPEELEPLPPELPPALIDKALEMEADEQLQREAGDPVWPLDPGPEILPVSGTDIGRRGGGVQRPPAPIESGSEQPHRWWHWKRESAERTSP